MTSRFEAAFAKAHPQYRLSIRWYHGAEALSLLSGPGQGGVDVYWAASPRTFDRLKAAGAFQSAGIDRDGLPDHVGGTRISDADGYYLATELAGYGFVFDAAELGRLGVAVPRDWTDLADPRLAGRIALPNPARVGFAQVMADIVLQSYGWERGWALWSEIAGLSVLVGSGGRRVAEAVGPGRAAIGLSIDFLAAAAIAGGAPLGFAYPRHGGINPAHIAITAGAPNPDGARAFARFVLSGEGQRLLADPDIRRLPVRPAVYAGLPVGYHDPFAAAAAGGYAYDNAAGRDRLALVASAFEQMYVQGHEHLAALWGRIHAAERRGLDARAMRARLCAPPLSETEAAAPVMLARFRDRPDGAEGAPRRVEIDWQWAAAKARSEVGRMLDEAGA
ncbi:ABC transporter substrate-binding protein [Thauera sinica]|nr:ABC transporter substrate-binding protein [Thauera sp. K11]